MGRSFKVGIFVLLGLILIGAATFMIGNERQLWDRHALFHAAFGDVGGLKPGSPIRMGGIDVGTVKSVEHGTDVNDRRIHVTLSIVRGEADRLRADTTAQIENKGLLGDKMVTLSTDGVGPPLAEGGELKTKEAVDFASTLGTLANKASHALTNVDEATSAINDPALKDDLKESVTDLRLILDGLARKDSAAHRLLMDPTEGAKLDRALTNLEASSDELRAATANARALTEQVKTGPGLAHALIYDGALSEHAAGAVAEVHKDLEAIRTGNGLAHSLLYGDSDSQRVMSNVNAMSDDLRAIVHDVRQGKGTLGALLVDPSVYEDIRGLVGNVERNEVLRALVRYSIKADEKDDRAPKVTPGQAVTTTSGPSR
jgi:phospholipid/cholesterol/gamma-HCH transport system substrate-binding protein